MSEYRSRFVPCQLCGKSIPVKPRGRFPERHPECKDFEDVFAAAERRIVEVLRVHGMKPGNARELRDRLADLVDVLPGKVEAVQQRRGPDGRYIKRERK
jgi:hypothetical protein